MKKKIWALLLAFNFVTGALISQNVFAEPVTLPYRADFTSGIGSEWQIKTYHSGLWAAIDGKLQFGQSNQTSHITIENSVPNKYEFNAVFTPKEFGSGAQLFIVSEFTDENNYNFCSISQGGQCKIGSVKGGQWSRYYFINNDTDHPGIGSLSKGTSYKLTVMAVNHVKEFYVNDKLICAATFEEPLNTSGRIGFRISNLQAEIKDVTLNECNDIIIDNTFSTDKYSSVGTFNKTGDGWGHNITSKFYGSYPENGEAVYLSASPGDSAVWTPNIPTSGRYDIYMIWPSRSDGDTAASIKISNGASEYTTQADQSKNGLTWNKLGTYNLYQGTGNSVSISFVDSKLTFADAVKFVYVGELENPVTITSSCTDKSGNSVTSQSDIRANDTLTFNVSGRKDPEKVKADDAIYLIAVYDGSRIFDLGIGKIKFDAENKFENLSISVNTPADVSKCSIKAFVWNNMTNMIPIAEKLNAIQ